MNEYTRSSSVLHNIEKHRAEYRGYIYTHIYSPHSPNAATLNIIWLPLRIYFVGVPRQKIFSQFYSLLVHETSALLLVIAITFRCRFTYIWNVKYIFFVCIASFFTAFFPIFRSIFSFLFGEKKWNIFI